MLDKFNITVICVVPSYLGAVDDKYKKKKYFREEINGVNVFRVRVPEFSKINKVSRIKNILAYFLERCLQHSKLEKWIMCSLFPSLRFSVGSVK